MIFNSMQFLVFYPLVVLLYFVFPKRTRYIWLLAASYFFYMCWNPRHIWLLLISTVTTYAGGLLLGYFKEKSSSGNILTKGVLSICICVNLLILFFFKYFDFMMLNVDRVLGTIGIHIGIPEIDVLLPIGISFYTFQAIGYVVDVYRGDTRTEKNFLKYALFVSFFPQLVAGPIERSRNLLEQVKTPKRFDVENARNGLLIMAYGLWLKVVVADNIANIIDPVYEAWEQAGGMTLIMATVLFAFQIYCDFQGYSLIAKGSAQVLGFRLQDNFNAPYCADSVQDFWRRWHMSLTTWFRDYIYIPLGGNRKGKIRKNLNTMIVFLLSGLWHGANWHYVVWGGINGFYLVMQDITQNIRAKIREILKIDTKSAGWRMFRGFVTFILIDYAWLYFRVSLGTAVGITKRIYWDFRIQDLLSYRFYEIYDNKIRKFMIVNGSILILMAVDYLKRKGINVREKLLKQQFVFRWMIYIGLIVVILVFGAYGEDYGQTQFIYFQF